MRKKLIELVNEAIDWREPTLMLGERIADHLIANGVTFATDNNVGHWITKNGNTFCSECMVCGSPKWKVCPVCEARMVGDELSQTADNMSANAEILDVYIPCQSCGALIPAGGKNECLVCRLMRLATENIAQKWIPVTERLPERPEYDWVLVQVKMNPEDYYGVPHIAELRNGTWYDEDDLPLEEFRSVIVTHWMSLPDPPKGE